MERPAVEQKGIIIVGAGDTALALLRSLGTGRSISLMDIDAAKLERFAAALPPGFSARPQVKDGTSLLNLREAGLDNAECIIALTDRDEVNVEICRVALSANQTLQAVAVVSSDATAEQAKAVGAEPILRPQAIAGMVANVILRGLRVAVSIGLGRGEVLEIPVLPSSPVANARIKDLHARRWLVAAIYRGTEIIVPHGDAVIRIGDRLLLTGEPDILPDIAEFLRTGVARFPLQFGRRLLVLDEPRLGARYWDEVHYLARHARVNSLACLTNGQDTSAPKDRDWPLLPTALPYRGELADFLRSRDDLDCGCLVLPKHAAGLLQRIGLRRPRYSQIRQLLPCPTLFATGVRAYKRILLPVTESSDIALATELAIDLSRQLSVPLAAVTVSQPAFVSGDEDATVKDQALTKVKELTAPYRLQVELLHKQGNPVRELTKRVCQPDDLLVLTKNPSSRGSLLHPDVTDLLIANAPCSVIVLTQTAATVGRRA
jgi:Trk K+ transport system NAD-binding subunit/nucleotide-binding universal stress UspA family protein